MTLGEFPEPRPTPTTHFDALVLTTLASPGPLGAMSAGGIEPTGPSDLPEPTFPVGGLILSKINSVHAVKCRDPDEGM